MKWYLETKHPVAVDSVDHIYPCGTSVDNSRSGNFNTKLIRLLPRPVSVLDLGCAGGGFVQSLIEMGQISVGLEGSDFSKVNGRAEWTVIPDNLFTCDITYPFTLHTGDGQPYPFDVVTAWEVVEHIEDYDLPKVFENIRRHLKKGGLFIFSTPRYRSNHEHANGPHDHHRTRRLPEWWVETVTNEGFHRQSGIEQYFGRYWVRRHGTGQYVFSYG